MADAGRPTLALPEEVRRSADADWQAAVSHRLFRAIIDDTVDDRVFDRYLRIEFGFIDTAAVVLGAAVLRAPGIEDRQVLAAGLHELLTSQYAFFADSLGDDLGALAPPSARPLHLLFGEVAQEGSYVELLAAMMATEWLYETWCALVPERPSGRDTIRAWVGLHTADAFRRHAAWLRERLDAIAYGLSPLEHARIGSVFRRAIVAEIAFHDAAYDA
jgi:thiaminase (transcriptional activator TenA)